MVNKAKPNANDLRRLIGYMMITFMSVYFFPRLMVCSFILAGNDNAKKLVNIKEVSYNMQVTR